jgi:hypothetical protein
MYVPKEWRPEMKGRTILIAGLLTAAFAGQGGAQTITIVGSPHDLGGDTVNDNGEICVYCHTPHAARTDIEAPLWNKPSTNQTYQPYDSTTVDGDILTAGSVSVACLTCHDGTQARDAVINAPGSGLGAGTMGGLAAFAPTDVANLGIDLRNDHPIGIQYGGFVVGPGKIDPDFKGTGEGLQTATINGGPRWWVDTEASPGNGTRNKTDMILFTRLNVAANEPFVECATCHDPHAGDASLVTEVNFMRISNTGSSVCLACHVK